MDNIYPPSSQLPPHHAPHSLKLVMLLFAIVLVGALGYFVWAQNRSVDSTDFSAPSVKKQTTTTKTATDPTATWKAFKSAIVNLSFKYPSDGTYAETEPLAERVKTGLEMTGHQAFFADSTKAYPSFNATTSDFTAKDSVPQDIITGTLDSKTSFTVATMAKATMITTEVAPGMFHVTGYGNIECSPNVNTYLFVRPPQGSNLKYISFFLGTSTEFAKNELDSQDPCTPLPTAITAHIAALDVSSTIKPKLDLAVSIAKTFSAK